jgi:predicted nucleotidyltransferase
MDILRIGCSRTGLFGSRAKGTAREDSDADIALEFFAQDNEVTRLFLLNGDGWQDDLRRRTGLEVNIAHLAGIFTPMHCQAVAEDGVELYRKNVRASAMPRRELKGFLDI